MPLAQEHLPHYTYNDYIEWEGKWELIEGIPFAMSPAPIPQHQRVAVQMALILEQALKNGCKKCKVYMPVDWKVADYTIVQPDVLVVCKTIEKKYLDFAPHLVVEILSPSTAFNDRGIKFEIYQTQKVKYYLIIDPQFKKIEIYELINNAYAPVAVNPSTYTFTFDDECIANTTFEDAWD
jgi:Uma2 family endonuclease